MQILHLSDLHFGYDKDDSMKTQRENLLNSLIDMIMPKTIDIVIITGDVVWQCKEEGYVKAEDWLKKLRDKIDVPFSNFIICAGNHEVDHNETQELSYITDAEKIKTTLKFENIDRLKRRFMRFIDFCEKLGVTKPKLNNIDNYLIGTVNFDDVKFWIINTAWYALNGGSADKNQLWIGTSFYDFLFEEKRRNSKQITICLNHHPKEWLNENETQTENNHKSLFEMISEQCEINFTGHTHGNIQEPTKYHNRMWSFSAGSLYQSIDYSHNFSIFSLNIHKKEVARKAFISENRTEWRPLQHKLYNLSNIVNISTTYDGMHITEDSKTGVFKQVIDKIGINRLNVFESDFSSNKVILWPVVPRRMLTSIHLAQLEFMSLLCIKFGWSIQAIISNCGANPLPKEEADAFIKKVEKYHERMGVQNFEYEFLDKYFKKEHNLAPKVLESFIKICSRVNIPNLKEIKEKHYDEAKKEEINKQAVLDYILPILQFAVVEALTHEIKRQCGKKSIIVAGNDEKIQWNNAVSVIGEDFVGALLIPELNKNNGININQDNQNQNLKTIIECCSKDQLKENLCVGNIASWFYRMFIVLPNYENLESINIFTENPSVDRLSFWPDEHCIPNEIDKNKLIDQIWSKIEKGKMSE